MTPAFSLRRLFLLTVGLPAIVVVADEWAMRFVRQQRWSALGMGVLYVLFVAQVGLLGMVVGRFVERWFLRWFVLVWGLVLIDLMLFCIVVDQPYRWRDWGYCLPYALLSGQLGLVVIWGIFGPVAWPWRLPGFFVAAMMVMSFAFALEDGGGIWGLLALIQGLATVGLCFFLWSLGLRMTLPGGAGVRGDEPAGNKVFQFSIGHMLLWTLALVPILLLAQGLDFRFLDRVTLWGWLGLLLAALGLGVVSLIAIWAALGRGSAAIRFSTLAVVPALLAIVPESVGTLLTSAFRARPLRWDYITGELADLGWGWLVWTLLATWFLAGLLLMFRASGYRLEWAGRGRGVDAPGMETSSC